MSITTLWRFHQLFLEVRDNGKPGFGDETLVPWLEQHPEIVAELAEIGRPIPRLDQETLWGLYALSRLVEILIAPHQPPNDDPALLSWIHKGQPWWQGPMPSHGAWAGFIDGIGAKRIAEDRFHPFFHEIVEVVAAPDPDQPPELVAEVWPGALIGGMVLIRAGVKVTAGRHHLDPEAAARSCLYWAWWRRNRMTRDQSHGWGHNSQWRTAFRRDYVVGDELRYNVDSIGRTRPGFCGDDDLPVEVERELVRFRHSTTKDLGEDCWAYDSALVETRS